VLVGARKLRGRGIGLFITWWKDLGDGRPADETWTDQIGLSTRPEKWRHVRYGTIPVVEVFEGQNTRYLDFDEVMTRADWKELLRLSPIQ
jgi:hypothetical protein